MAFLLKQDGGKILKQDGGGILLQSTDTPVIAGPFPDPWQATVSIKYDPLAGTITARVDPLAATVQYKQP